MNTINCKAQEDVKVFYCLNEMPQDSRVCLYGTGHYGMALYELLKTKRPDIRVIRFIDSFKKGLLYNVAIIGPDNLQAIEDEYDYIIIASDGYRDELKRNLIERGITSYYDFLFNPLEVTIPVNRSRNDNKSSANVLYAFYDLAVYPGTFEIIDFLILAEIERRKKGYTHLHPIIVPKPEYILLHDESSGGCAGHDNPDPVNWRIHNILLPCCWLMPSCAQATVCSSRSEAHDLSDLRAPDAFPVDYNVDSPGLMVTYNPDYFNIIKNEKTLPSLQATPTALDLINSWIASQNLADRRIVTITLRECHSYPERNSTVAEWAQFAKSLDNDLFYPVFVRDTFASLNSVPAELEGLNIFQEACWNIELRMALYELSYVNMFVSNGPATLCIYNQNTSYLIYKMLVESCYLTSAASYENMGYPAGYQYPQATAKQNIIWSSDDTLKTISKHFNEFCMRTSP